MESRTKPRELRQIKSMTTEWCNKSNEMCMNIYNHGEVRQLSALAQHIATIPRLRKRWQWIFKSFTSEVWNLAVGHTKDVPNVRFSCQKLSAGFFKLEIFLCKRRHWPRHWTMEVQSLAINALTKRIQEEAKVLPDFLAKLCNQFCLHVVSTSEGSTYNYRCISYTIIYSIHRAIKYI